MVVVNMLILILFITPVHTEAAGKMPDGSTIANISIEKMSDSEVKKKLETELTIWQSGEDINLLSDFEQFTIPRSVFEFDIDATINQFNDRTKRTFTSLFMRQKNVQIPLQVTIDEKHEAIQNLKERDYINFAETIASLEANASQLEGSDIQIIYIEGKDIPLETIAEVELKTPNLSNAVLNYAIDELENYVIGPEEHFSLLETVVFPENLTKSNKELNFLGTALYSLFLQTNFTIVERHANVRLPAYAEPGIDASVSVKENKDLIVVNPTKLSYKLEVERKNDILSVALKSSKSDITYQYELENVREIKQRTIYRYSNKLKPGEKQTIEAGSKGLKVEVYRSTYDQNVFTESELISKDFYLPEPTIILVSSDDVVEEDTTDENLEIEGGTGNVDGDNGLGIIDDGLIDPNAPLISEQLQQLKEMQEELERRFAAINEAFEKFYQNDNLFDGLFDEEEMDEETEEKIKEFYEWLFDLILKGEGEETNGEKEAR